MAGTGAGRVDWYISLLYQKAITWKYICIKTRDSRTETLPQWKGKLFLYSLQPTASKDMRPANTRMSELGSRSPEAGQ